MKKDKVKTLYKSTAKVVRISGPNYAKFKKAKDLYALKIGKPKVSFDEFLAELINVADLFIHGHELYGVEDKLFHDLAEARGQAILNAVQNKLPPEMPMILVEVGTDTGLSK